ncbi:hypothetical protein HER14_15520 [Acidithiobacillus thiooxidans]|uniref:hypothetical protein n=1 Tax=Acidithiobacillus thiooxidans TaxID=930 RepID=UPI001C07297C|nr:hypothetical protein [Acidithiobacillus thiooxidans]MBU2752300.1 hypothetical protein [Acidithiobacillus thiooxidans]
MMFLWVLFFAFLFSTMAGLSLFLLDKHHHSLAAWVLVAALILMAAQQWSQVFSVTTTKAVSHPGIWLSYWPGILGVAAAAILDTRWRARWLFMSVGLLGIALALLRV